MTNTDRLLTAKDVRRILGVKSLSTVSRMVASGELVCAGYAGRAMLFEPSNVAQVAGHRAVYPPRPGPKSTRTDTRTR